MQVNSYGNQEVKSSGPHPDYAKNLSLAKTFVGNVQKSPVEGLSIRISDLVVNVSFKPPIDSKMGTHAFPINMHQPHSDFSKEIEKTYSYYFNQARKFWSSRDPKQLSIPYPETAQKADSVATDALMWWDR